MIYTLVIKTKDEIEPYRTQAGDILTVGDADHKGGYSSRMVNLMVKVDFGDIELNDAKKMHEKLKKYRDETILREQDYGK